MTDDLMKSWARRGAVARLAEIDAEAASINRAFPDLGTSSRLSREVPLPRAKARRGGWKMSAAQRRAVSARMKKYWAGRRAPKKRTMSAAGRKRIAAAQRKRWAALRKAKKAAAAG